MEVDKVVKKILESSTEIIDKISKQLPRHLKNLKINFKELPSPVPSEIGAVDGGNHVIEFMGLDVILVSAAGIYFPLNTQHQSVSDFDVHYLTEMYRNIQNYAGFLRDTMEIQQAIELLKFQPKMIFLDGTLSRLTAPSIPRTVWALLRQEEGKMTEDETPMVQRHYNVLLTFVEKLHELLVRCRNQNIPVVGVAKDSRVSLLGKTLGNKLKDDIKLSDVILISEKFRGQTGYVEPFPTNLNPNEVSQVQQRLRELGFFNHKGEWLDVFYTSYIILKAGHPAFRVEIPSWALDQWHKILETIHGWHDNNGFIIPAHHTHKEAHVPPDLIELVTKILQGSTSTEKSKELHLMLREKRRTVIG